MTVNEDTLFRNAEEIAVRYFLAATEEGKIYSEELRENILDSVLSQKIGDVQPFSMVDRDILRKRLEQRFNIIISPPKILEDTREHVAWLQERKASGKIEWKLWNRYFRFLIDVRERPPAVVSDLDHTTDEILGRLEDPVDLERNWDRRGIVVGQVQSGKTANYTGLICKAFDAGYKIVLVLAGPYNNLRSQVQRRLDEELLGFDTSQFTLGRTPDGRVGVGKLSPEILTGIIPLTNQLEDGDFKIRVARQVTIGPGSDPILLVVKKNATILRTLLRYLSTGPSSRIDKTLKRNIISGVPLLVVDDEADYGSVNTVNVPRDENGNFAKDYDPSTINRLIRSLLMTFKQRAYVGYTATPFANIFIHSELTHNDYGPDLFPDSFIISMQTPSDYIGPSRIFGTLSSTNKVLPLLRPIDDQESFVPDGHKNGFMPEKLNNSLRLAIQSFILTCAARRARGERSVHNSMLVHVTRYISTQDKVAQLVSEEIESIRNRLKYGDGARGPSMIDLLRELWFNDYVSTTQSSDMGTSHVDWKNVEIELLPSIEKMDILTINGTAADVLNYKENEAQGINVIVIGGDKLSRGMTFEGLSISYFLRSSRMYDTLLQMGRWFGYRPRYADLCRIFTTDQIVDYYQMINEADEELRQEFDHMVDRKETPRTYGLRVRSHKGLMVTSSVKMRHGIKLDLAYQGDISETTLFDPDQEVVGWNRHVTDTFLRNMSTSPKITEGYVLWSGVPAAEVVNFLKSFRTHQDAPHVNGVLMGEYIETQDEIDELQTWSVALLKKQLTTRDLVEESSDTPEVEIDLGGYRLVTTKRSPVRYEKRRKIVIKRVVSPRHEQIDISADEWKKCDEERISRGISPVDPVLRNKSGKYAREARPRKRGLMLIYPLNPTVFQSRINDVNWKFRTPDTEFRLSEPLIGLALSFPSSPFAIPIQYNVNNVWWEQEQGSVD